MSMIVTLLLGLVEPAADAPASPIPSGTGEVRNCIDPRRIQGTRLSAEYGYFVRLGTKDWWRNLGGGCPAYAPRRSTLNRSSTERLCAGDLVEVYNLSAGIGYGACRLGRWEKLTAAPDLPVK